MNADLITDYIAFERRRTTRRQYMKAFGGMALIVLAGGALHRVPREQALIVAGLLLALPLWLGAIEALHWRRLVHRLGKARAAVRVA